MFDQYGMPTSGYAQQPSQVGNRASKPISPFSNSTGVVGPNGDFNNSSALQQATNPQPQQSGGGSPFDRQKFQNDWMGSSGSIDDFLASHPEYAGQLKGSGDVRTLPTGESLDLVGDYGGRNTHEWTGVGGADGHGGTSAALGSAISGQGGPGGSGYSPYTPGQLPQANYSTYAPGQQSPQQQALLNSLMSGGSLSPDVQAQMQGQLKDQAMTMQKGQQQQLFQNSANQGWGHGGPALQAQLGQLSNDTNTGLLNNYRDLGVSAAQINRGDQLNALNASEQMRMNQEGLNQQGVNSQNNATNYALQRALEEEGLKQAAAGLGVQTRGQDINSTLATQQMAQQNSQFGQSLGQNNSQFYAGLNNNNQLAILKALGLA